MKQKIKTEPDKQKNQTELVFGLEKLYSKDKCV